MIDYIPIFTTILSAAFAVVMFRRYRLRASEGAETRHLLWWTIGIVIYGAGTLTEAVTTLFGWHEPVFRTWYIVGALMGGAPLAQGSVFLFFGRRWGDRMAVIAFTYVAIAAVFVLIAPVDAAAATSVLSGKVFEWRWVRLFSPFINTYAFIFLVGGAGWSAYRYLRVPGADSRVLGNVLIAIGALLPGIGGSSSRAGHTEVLYVTEFIGLILIYLGYRLATRIGREPVATTASSASPAS